MAKVNQRIREKPSASRTPARVKGASQHKVGFSSRSSAWLANHRFNAADSLRRLLASPLQSFLTWLVVAIALALPTALYLGLQNIEAATSNWEGNARVSVFMEKRAREAAVEQLQAALQSRAEVASVTYISPEQAMAELEAYSGLDGVLDSLDNNPLPAVLVVEPLLTMETSVLDALVTELRANPVVEDVRLDMQWVQRLQSITELGRRIVLALTGLLALGVVVVIGNTIRLTIENRKAEIQVVKLVGGTDGFVRRPFLYTGLWYGLGGGLLAIILVSLGLQWLSGPIESLTELYSSDFSLLKLEFAELASILAGAALLGWLGAWLAVSRHLRAIQPA